MSISYIEAIRLALDDSLAADPRVFLYGQDIAGSFGGAFKATKGLSEKHPGRVLNAPISEDAIAGVAVGAAIDGMRPVVEFQFADFSTLAFNQLMNNAGTMFWRTGHRCPLVARLPVGGTKGSGPFHCQMPDGWITNPPGLVVLAPATVADAYWMLRDAIALDDPVVFCEHKYLYSHLKDTADPRAGEHLPLGVAAVRREGTDCTLVSYSGMLHEALGAAGALERDHGLSVEVIDLRCLRPLDLGTIIDSVSRTGRLVVASESWPFGGVPAELVARIAGEAFHFLDAPPRRLCALDTPIPVQADLYAAHRPNAARIAEAVLETVRF
jgi:pyruvate dehydrogenase E1 component beta subunit/2-oxoisovalerate dehydrogenase E1 component beta subunit